MRTLVASIQPFRRRANAPTEARRRAIVVRELEAHMDVAADRPTAGLLVLAHGDSAREVCAPTSRNAP
jgi:hypothetical protein